MKDTKSGRAISPQRDCLSILRAALAAADAGNAVRRHVRRSRHRLIVGRQHFDLRFYERIFVISIGKAAVPMAHALEEILGQSISQEIVVTKQGHVDRPLRCSMPLETGHPIPDAAGQQASRAVGQLLRELNARDLLVVALSGGASALLPAPAGKITLAAKQKTTDLLLRAGANIHQLNSVRKHLSLLKGGRLASLAYPATVVSLLLSDVVGDGIDVIGSGPTVPDPSTYEDAWSVLASFQLLQRVPRRVLEHLEMGRAGRLPETPKPGDPIFESHHTAIVGSNALALEAAAGAARELGYNTLILSSSMEGETREVAAVHAQILREVVRSRHPLPAPACILSGGETTVTIRGEGKGGRNQEFALAAAFGLNGLQNVAILSAGTDGTDGPTDAAGAIVTGSTIERAKQLGLDARAELARNNSYVFFDALGDLVHTGATGTNVMDIHVLLAG